MPYETASNPKTGQKAVLIGNEWKVYTQSATGPNGEQAYLVDNKWIAEPPKPETLGESFLRRSSQFAKEVINPVIAPYTVAAATGAAAGAPFAGIGAAPGAAFGVAALGAGDIATSMYNVGRMAVGAEPVRTPSQIIRETVSGELPVVGEIVGEPTSRPAQVARTVAEFAVPAQAQARAANILAERVTRSAPTVARNVLAEMGAQPNVQTAQAAAAGGAVETAREFGATGPLVETTAALLGGTGAAVTPALVRAGGRVGYNILEPIMAEGGSRIRSRAYLQAFNNDPMRVQAAIDALEAGATPEQVALQTGNSNFAALIGTAKYANTVVRDLYAARDSARQEALATKLAQVKADEVSTAATLEAREGELAGAVPTPSKRATGRRIVAERQQMIKDRQREVVTPAYERAFDLAPDAFSITPIIRTAQKLADDPLVRLDPNLAPETSQILSQYKDTPKITLRTADAIIKAINLDLRGLPLDARVARRNLTNLRNSVDQAIQQGVSPEARTAYADALKAYEEQIATPFYKGWVAKLPERARTGEAAVAPTNIVTTALRNEDNALRFVEAFRDNQKAMGALREGILGLYRKTAVKGGRVDPAKHRQFMETYRAQLGILDNAGLNVRPILSEFGKRAMGLEGRRALLDDLAQYTKEAESALEGVTPDVSATRIVGATREIPELKKVVDEINAAVSDQRRFNKLTQEGVRAGGGVSGIVKEETADIPSLLSRPAMLANFILSRVKGQLDVRTASQVAVDLINSNSAAQALSNALVSRRGKIGEFLFEPITVKRPAAIAPGVVTNILGTPENQNALRP